MCVGRNERRRCWCWAFMMFFGLQLHFQFGKYEQLEYAPTTHLSVLTYWRLTKIEGRPYEDVVISSHQPTIAKWNVQILIVFGHYHLGVFHKLICLRIREGNEKDSYKGCVRILGGYILMRINWTREGSFHQPTICWLTLLMPPPLLPSLSSRNII